jgi:small-conductance mechanosensitive channel
MMQSQVIPGSVLGDSEAESNPETGEAAEATEFFDLSIDVEPYLPDAALPAWAFLQDYPLLLVLLMFAIGFGVGKAVQWLVRMPMEHATRRTKSRIDDHMIEYLTDPITQTAVILALVAAVKSFGFDDFIDQVLIRILFSILLFFWARAWFRATTLLLAWMSKENRFKAFEPRTRPLFDMGVKLVLVSLFVWMFMALWDIDGTAWLASAGVIGIAVGFAARDTLANLISGVSIIADAPYKIGDYIVLDTGERGVVTDLGMRSTRLLTRDDVEISIPNAVMGNAKITNESGGPAVEHRIRIPIGVAYGTRPQHVVEALEAVARDNDMVLPHPAPRVRMRAFAESSVNFELLVWIRLPEQRGLALHKLLMEIEEKFRQEGIQIPFPQRDIHIRTQGEDSK